MELGELAGTFVKYGIDRYPKYVDVRQHMLVFGIKP